MTSLGADYQDWWETVWSERERLLKKEFGETSPPGKVISFRWDDLDLMIPGACAMVFPPAPPYRPAWLTVSHGLSQPLEPSVVGGADSPSGYGYELGFLTRRRESWCAEALWQLMTYMRQSGTAIERGDRVPMWFLLSEDGPSYVPKLGKVSSGSKTLPAGEMRAVVFWPFMAHPAGFSTSTGYFTILLGTTITQSEWDLAKGTSTSHLLVSLCEAGIGQVSELKRASVTREKKWQDRWEQLCRLPQETVDEMLLDSFSQ